ncbi:MAG: D-aminoacylase [Firmicutes bacterium]|nr:D-aminoacylase [Bacillota bacterium]
MEILIKNARIIDGTGKPAYRGDVGIENGKIILDCAGKTAEQTIDAEGLYVSPGFIDCHSHGDGVYGKDYGQLCKINQGITTEMCGQCGSTFYPVNPQTLPKLKELLSVICPDFPEEMVTWKDYKTYKEYLKDVPLVANTGLFTGHSALRTAVLGFENRKATPEELEQMKALLKEAMEEGSFGMTTGLVYAPGAYSDTEELVELAKVMAPYDGIYATHLRNEAEYVVEAVREALEIGRRAGVRVQISHHKAYGKRNWGLSKETLALVEEAIANGQKVTLDQYPYEASMTHFNVLLPVDFFAGGFSQAVATLVDPAVRETLKERLLDEDAGFDNYYQNCGGFGGVFAAVLPKTPEYNGMFVSEIAEKLGKDPFETYFDLVLANNGEGTGIFFSMCEEDMVRIIQDPNTCVGTDGIVKAMTEAGHPRGWATFPHAICYYHKKLGLFTLEEIIHKMTGLPAERFMLDGKGLIEEGKDADLVIFDYEKLADMATYADSNRLTEGIEYVIVNGQIVYKDKQLTGVYPGELILHSFKS